MSMFQRAVKTESYLRMALIGPSGVGKTYSALTIGGGLSNKIAVIDTEHGSASKYADLFAFDALNLTRHSPRDYIAAIKDAEQAGYGLLIIDSLSHAWMGNGGALEMVDAAAARSQSRNSFTAWKDVTPEHNKLVQAMLGSRLHIIATLRSKTEYVLDRGKDGKTEPRKVGLAPVQRDGLEYEFDVVGEMDQDNNLIISKTRCSALRGAVIPEPGAQLAATLNAWLTAGAPRSDKPQTPAEAAARFYARFGDVVHGDAWKDVAAYLGDGTPEPQTIEGWIDVARSVMAIQTRTAEVA